MEMRIISKELEAQKRNGKAPEWVEKHSTWIEKYFIGTENEHKRTEKQLIGNEKLLKLT